MKTPQFWQNMSKKQRKEAINTIIIVVVVIGGTFGAMGVVKLALHTNIPLVVVTSESMLPDIEVGDLLIVKGMDPSEIVAGDHEARNGSIIIYDTNGIWSHPISQPVVHRVINVSYNEADGKYYFITQGDNNSFPDPAPVPEDNVMGVVIHQIPKLGKVKIFLDSSGLTWVLIVILSVLLVISIIQDLIHPEEDEEKSQEEKKLEGKKTETISSESNSHDLGI
ncbi:MAG: signal peptidase I [Candidatus Cloacimonadota bacterium]|nr:MAG: signal peptidase I [Candidatus Cloacimonadota bacterium]